MNAALIAILALAAGSTIVGTVLAIRQLRICPEGYEDENGFHFGRFAEEQLRSKASRLKLEVEETRTAA